MEGEFVVNESARDDSEVVKILVVSIVDKQLGLACYDELTNTIRADGFDTTSDDIEAMLVSAKLICQPTLVLVHPRVVVNTPLLEMVTCGWDGVPGHYPYQAMKSSHWNFNTALELMCTKFFVRDKDHRTFDLDSLSYQENFLRLSSHFDMNNRPMVQSIGALIHFMRTYIFYLDDGVVSVNKVEGFTLGSYLRMDPGTSQSLQIFRTDYHPNVIKGKGKYFTFSYIISRLFSNGHIMWLLASYERFGEEQRRVLSIWVTGSNSLVAWSTAIEVHIHVKNLFVPPLRNMNQATFQVLLSLCE
jgi:hypothetical protein